MSALSFSSHPAFPYSIEEALTPGASYSHREPQRAAILTSLFELKSYFRTQLAQERSLEKSIGVTPSPTY